MDSPAAGTPKGQQELPSPEWSLQRGCRRGGWTHEASQIQGGSRAPDPALPEAPAPVLEPLNALLAEPPAPSSPVTEGICQSRGLEYHWPSGGLQPAALQRPRSPAEVSHPDCPLWASCSTTRGHCSGQGQQVVRDAQLELTQLISTRGAHSGASFLVTHFLWAGEGAPGLWAMGTPREAGRRG